MLRVKPRAHRAACGTCASTARLGSSSQPAGLAGLTYGFTAWPALGGTSPAVLAALAVGLGGMVGFVFAERRSPHPMVPLEVFASRAFTAANLVTFAVYAALGGVFFLVVLNLQVVAHFTPLAAGIALLPITALLLLLSARAGALAQRIGPRIPGGCVTAFGGRRGRNEPWLTSP